MKSKVKMNHLHQARFLYFGGKEKQDENACPSGLRPY